ncbi:hypothetical protein PAMC26577_03975 [Caballeronia sordidicola]|uniref:Uncharacterized protein n=1 Tax=Caballeronia sordidicola TaxID=196367 RepID=A0A242N505_CABSO|nr:hypothetical protein PAMC26577_03975 [Caballeronia sordidicola]
MTRFRPALAAASVALACLPAELPAFSASPAASDWPEMLPARLVD